MPVRDANETFGMDPRIRRKEKISKVAQRRENKMNEERSDLI